MTSDMKVMPSIATSIVIESISIIFLTKRCFRGSNKAITPLTKRKEKQVTAAMPHDEREAELSLSAGMMLRNSPFSVNNANSNPVTKKEWMALFLRPLYSPKMLIRSPMKLVTDVNIDSFLRESFVEMKIKTIYEPNKVAKKPLLMR